MAFICWLRVILHASGHQGVSETLHCSGSGSFFTLTREAIFPINIGAIYRKTSIRADLSVSFSVLDHIRSGTATTIPISVIEYTGTMSSPNALHPSRRRQSHWIYSSYWVKNHRCSSAVIYESSIAIQLLGNASIGRLIKPSVTLKYI